MAPRWHIGTDVLVQGRLALILRGELLGVPLEVLRAEEKVGQCQDEQEHKEGDRNSQSTCWGLSLALNLVEEIAVSEGAAVFMRARLQPK